MGAQFYFVTLGVRLQTYFTQDSEWTKHRAGATLAVRLHFLQLLNLLACLFRFGALLPFGVLARTLGTLFLLICLERSALRFE